MCHGGIRVLNYIWAFMLLISIMYGAWTGNLSEVSNAILDSSAQAVSLAVSMAGVVALWCGLMEIAEHAGVVKVLARILRPIIGWLFPGLKGERGERAREYITLNFIMNMLGTGWSATGPGLMAMEELDRLAAEEEETENGRHKSSRTARTERTVGRTYGIRKRGVRKNAAKRATDEMCTFLVLNVSSLQLIPINIIAYRSAYGSASPTAIILPALLATGASTLVAVMFCKAAAFVKRIGRL